MAQRSGRADMGLTHRWATGVAARCDRAMKRLGVTAVTPLGCGAYGCVFPARQGVVKVVNDESVDEVSAARWLLAQGARAPDAFPRIFGVYRLGGCAGKQTSFVIHREDVFDLPDEWIEEARGKKAPTAESIGSALFSALWNIENAGVGAFGSCDVAQETMDQYRGHYGSQYPALRPILKAAADLQRWACENEVEVLDTHPMNWGRRKDGTFVLRDFGGAYSEDGQSFRQPRFAPGRAPALASLTGREGRVVFAGLVGW